MKYFFTFLLICCSACIPVNKEQTELDAQPKLDLQHDDQESRDLGIPIGAELVGC